VTTVAKELWVAVSGLALVLFVIVHLAGNFTLFAGPDAFNAYSRHLHSLGMLLWLARLGLIAAFVTHAVFTVWLFFANRAARKTSYAVNNRMGGTDLAKLTMIYSGAVVLVFVVLHLHDFTFRNAEGAAGAIADSGNNLGLYGLVWNSFSKPSHVIFYVVCMCALGLHLSNVISTIWVTLGVLTDAATPRVNLFARVIGVLLALGFSSIPIYVLAVNYWAGV
jgi:succinate dehydrogenase / fumarate reductase cytochrome b subunit